MHAPILPVDAARLRARPRAVAFWLLAVTGLIFIMVVVGGITRLTESGLSMVRWEPVSGILPPLSAAAWEAEFAAYRASPEYRQVNAGMSLVQFQGIYFWEYVHRVLGRLIGLAFALPLAWFAWKRAIPRGHGRRLVALLALGALQGAIGWWMVKSGLVDVPEVAHERLAVHLTLALVIMAGCLWAALDLLGGDRDRGRPRAWIVPFAALLTVQIVWGAFTAGLDAGHAASDWPTMLGSLVPGGLSDPLNDPVTVQWVHRTLAWAVAGAALWIAWACRGAGARAAALAVVVLAQFALGVATVTLGVPLAVAAAHQAGAALLVLATVGLAHWARR